MAKFDQNTINGVYEIEARLESLLDHIIIYRQSTIYKREYRKISNKLEKALTFINEALDEIKKPV